METESVSTGVHDKLIQTEADHADYSEREEFSPGILYPALSEYPSSAEQVIADQAEDKRDRGRPKIRQPRLLCEKPKAAIIDHKRNSPDNGISEELPDKAIGFFSQNSLK